MRPQDVVANRRVMTDLYRHHGSIEPFGEPVMDLPDLARDMFVITSDCDSYLVSADMTAVALAAGRTMPIETLLADDLPSRHGFLLYDAPLGYTHSDRPMAQPLTEDGDAPVVGFLWGNRGPRQWVKTYWKGEGDDDYAMRIRELPDVERRRLYRGDCPCGALAAPLCDACASGKPSCRCPQCLSIHDYPEDTDPASVELETRPCTCPVCTCISPDPDEVSDEIVVYPLTSMPDEGLMPLTTSLFHGGELTWNIGDCPANDPWGVSGTLRATWTLMQQAITVSERVEGHNRAERRARSRQGLPPELLTVYTLRRRENSHEETGESAIDWSHRWIVDGHWRNQWLRGRQTHRLQWIAAYVKGPEDKPLVIKERVKHWVR